MSEILLNREGAIARITLNRPEKLNALTGTMVEEWRKVLEELSRDSECRVVIVTGTGRAWSAGVDLSAFQEIKVEPGFQFWEDGMAVMHQLETMPQVTICALNGFCFTGAMELMMAFDLVIASDEAKIGDTHTKWGILPKWGMTQRLQHLVGLRKAKELSFTAQAISGKEAANIGLANLSVPASELEETVIKIANQIIENSAQTIAVVKELYHHGSRHGLEAGLKFEENYQAPLTDKTEQLANYKSNLKQ
ncbi:MAG: enoyl-CoA hydratase/isomerase family protein [Cytophagales bacterium]|nr:enoyl-CoA hydratase/isomerase family protein [Cytophagales bacterium]